MLSCMEKLNYIERLQKLKLLTHLYRRLRGDMIKVYKIMHGLYDRNVSPALMLCADESTRVLRGHIIYFMKARSQSFTQRVVNALISLPTEVINAPSLNTFKHRLDKFWNKQTTRLNWKLLADQTVIITAKFFSDTGLKDYKD